MRVHRRLQIDDCFLLGACACLTGATLLTFIKFSDLYFAEEFGLNVGRLPIPDDIFQRIYSYEDLYYSAPVLAWTAIYFVKFAYLYFFRVLVNRVRKLKIFRSILLVVAAISWPVCVISVYIPCTKRGLEAGRSSFLPHIAGLLMFDDGSGLSRAQVHEHVTGPRDTCHSFGHNHRYHELVTSHPFGFVQRLMLVRFIILPICILWRVRIKAHQKLGLGVFLSLNV